MKSIKYTTDGKYEVRANRTVVARSYVGVNGYEVRVLQGTNRMEIIDAIFKYCPEFAASNNLKRNVVPYLFSK